MAIPEWFFGPAGDLRPLPSTEMDVVDTVERFGGIHTAITGGRTVDVLGHKSRYEFDMKYLEPEEYSRLEAIYTGMTTGDLFLKNPLKKNLLSRESSSGKPAPSHLRGAYASTGTTGWVKLTDSPVEWTQRGLSWTISVENANLYFDFSGRIPSVNGDGLTYSVYVKCAESVDVSLAYRPYLASVAGTQVYGSTETIPADEWTRILISVPTNPGVADSYRFGLRFEDNTSKTVQFVCPQVELGAEATDADMGGGSAQVAIDSMDTTSPYFPLRNVSLTLLEV